MSSKMNELRAMIRKEIKAALEEASKTDTLQAQITKTQDDISKKSKVEKDKLANLYTQLGQELKKEK